MTERDVRDCPNIHFERRGRLGVVTLDRPRALNALTREMVEALNAMLARWRHDTTLGAVLVKAVPGRAFCAGGDVRAVVETAGRDGIDAAHSFFTEEYRLNWRVRRFPKPYISLLDGIVMGGGVGISVHGSHRIVTENTLFAMPETAIGMFPDVGASFVLPRLPGELGTWLGLTGARLDGAHCRAAGIGTHFVDAARLDALTDALVDGLGDGVDDGVCDRVLASYDEPSKGATPFAERAAIDRHLAAPDLPELVAHLDDRDDPFVVTLEDRLAPMSPIAVAITLRQLRRGAGADFDTCMRMEHGLVRHVLEHGDFAEGVRALLVDKDKRPRWRHASLEAVTRADIDLFFDDVPASGLDLHWDIG